MSGGERRNRWQRATCTRDVTRISLRHVPRQRRRLRQRRQWVTAECGVGQECTRRGSIDSRGPLTPPPPPPPPFLFFCTRTKQRPTSSSGRPFYASSYTRRGVRVTETTREKPLQQTPRRRTARAPPAENCPTVKSVGTTLLHYKTFL